MIYTVNRTNDMILIGNKFRMVPNYTDNNINQSNVTYKYLYKRNPTK